MQISSSKVRRFLQTLAVEDASILCKLALSKLTHSLFNVYHVFDFNPASVYQLRVTQFPPGVTLRLFRGEGDITYVATMLARAGMSLKTVEHWMRAVIWRRWSSPMTMSLIRRERRSPSNVADRISRPGV